MRGVDPGSPHAFLQILHNTMTLVPWRALIWFTVLCVLVGAVLGWWRRRFWLGVGLAFVLGPIGWFALWAFQPGDSRKTERKAGFPKSGGRAR